MSSWWGRLRGGGVVAPRETKTVQSLVSITSLGEADWSRRSFVSLVTEGFAKNPVMYRCIRLIAESANRVPLLVNDGGKLLSEHPLLTLLSRPNPRQSGGEMFEAVFSYLETAGNAYLSAGIVDGEVRELYALRPDRMRVVVDGAGWPVAYAYTVHGKLREFRLDAEPIAGVLHMALFDPLDDAYGMAPLQAAQQSLDIHNASAKWNKALLDNSAQPSGALVYAPGSNLSDDQFKRLKEELVEGFAGARNAGRPMVLEGGLDWKTIAMTPRDMDFIEARNAAARDIALAFGVPPMLLGIPGDLTYSNQVEANKALWRHTIIPLVRRVADDLSFWLGPAFGGVTLVPDLDGIEALAEDRAALWARIGGAGFLSDAEKRAMLGV
ncbi:MAG: Transfer Agent portal protein [Devosia sp.]|nr:Transfer Agent portal protein [Devosia sp.]